MAAGRPHWIAACLVVAGACNCGEQPGKTSTEAAQPGPPQGPVAPVAVAIPEGAVCKRFGHAKVGQLLGVADLPEGEQVGKWTCRFGTPSEPARFAQVQIARGSARTMQESLGALPAVPKTTEKIAEGGYSSVVGAGGRLVVLSKGRIIQIMGPADVPRLRALAEHVIATLDI